MAAERYRDRAAEFLELASNASNSDVQNRYVKIAQHYRSLAEAEGRSAEQKGTKRRSRRGASIAAITSRNLNPEAYWNVSKQRASVLPGQRVPCPASTD